jgi:hypothetical protein
MVAFYQHDIASWMDGTESLTDGEYRVYHVICELIYLNNGPILMNESGIAGRCNQHTLKFRVNFAKLIERKKLAFNEGGKITNARVSCELKKIASRRRSKTSDPQATSGQPGGGVEGVTPGSPGGKPAKPLKTQEGDLFAVPLEKKKKNIGTPAKAGGQSPLEIARKELFDRGKEVLGEGAGGMIQQLLAAKHGNIALARAAIEQASTMDNPRQYIGAIIRGGSNETNRNGYSKLGFSGIAARIRRQLEAEAGPAPDDLEPINGR